MKKLLLVFIILMFSCELNPYIDRECEVVSVYFTNEENSPIKYGLTVKWEQRGEFLPTMESFTINRSYYESLEIGDIVIYSDILLELE